MKALSIGFLLVASWMPASAAQIEGPAPSALMEDLMWGRGPIGQPFELVDHHGNVRNSDSLKGKVTILYFGYTHCPDVCPTDVLAITQAVQYLNSRFLQPVFITLDPERDTRELLNTYLGSFDDRWIGLTGDLTDIQKLAFAYKAWFAKSNVQSAVSYTVDHTSFIYILDADGQYVGFLPPGSDANRIAQVVSGIIGRH